MDLPNFLLPFASRLSEECIRQLIAAGFTSAEAFILLPDQFDKLAKVAEIKSSDDLNKTGVLYSIISVIQELKNKKQPDTQLAAAASHAAGVVAEEGEVLADIERYEQTIAAIDKTTGDLDSKADCKFQFPDLARREKNSKSDKAEASGKEEVPHNWQGVVHQSFVELHQLLSQGKMHEALALTDTMRFVSARAITYKGDAMVRLVQKIYTESRKAPDLPINDRSLLSQIAVDYLDPSDKFIRSASTTQKKRTGAPPNAGRRTPCFDYNDNRCTRGRSCQYEHVCQFGYSADHVKWHHTGPQKTGVENK
ncbi:MAG: hypothetical protein GY696_24950 [Gammaproteobacteria bacterium]|nr:hypothetical protein [Gammaproteobacteria bacterium]